MGTTKLPPLRIYLIGAGAIAHAHANACTKLPDPERITLSVTDPYPKALETFLAKYPHAHPYPTVQELLAEPALPDDIVIVATPPFTHCDLACTALATQRHVLCEKPFALTRQEAVQMLETARSVNRSIGCCCTRLLAVPTTDEARRIVASGTLGKLYSIRLITRIQRGRPGIEYQPGSRWFIDRAKSGGGPVMDWGPYDFAVLNDVLQPTRIDVLTAWTATPHAAADLPPDTVFDVEGHAAATLRYHLPNGDTTTVYYERSACTHGAEQMISEIEGLDGALHWEWLMDREGKVVHSFDNAGRLESTTRQFIDDSPIRTMDKPLYYFYQHIHGQPSPAIVNEQAVFNLSCLRAIYDCASTGHPQTITRTPHA